MNDSGGLVIVGAGGFGREVLDIVRALEAAGELDGFVGFLDDGEVRHDRLERVGARHLGCTDRIREFADRYVVAVGSSSVRQSLVARLDALGCWAVTLVHPAATIGGDSTFGVGCVVAAGARVTTNVHAGNHVDLHVNVAVGHDTAIGDFVSVFPGATVSGDVHIGAGVTIGMGANVLPGVSIGRGAYVGAGAVVIRDVADGVTVVGVPAREL